MTVTIFCYFRFWIADFRFDLCIHESSQITRIDSLLPACFVCAARKFICPAAEAAGNPRGVSRSTKPTQSWLSLLEQGLHCVAREFTRGASRQRPMLTSKSKI
jgi:hypothetical protein